MYPLFKAMSASEANFKAFEELLRVHKNSQADIA
jgi:predicted RNase H-like nuclease (RuvC/YqgF family)